MEPTRNRKVNSQLKQFCERVPIEEAPAIVIFYLGHNNCLLHSTGSHSVGALLADAEKLRTEWRTGRKITGQKARQDEQTATNFDNAERAIEDSRGGEIMNEQQKNIARGLAITAEVCGSQLSEGAIAVMVEELATYDLKT